MKLEDLQPGLLFTIEPNAERLEVVSARMVGSAAEIVYRGEDRRLGERLLYRADEPNLSQSSSEAPWTFDADGDIFRLVSEARRIQLAYFFDPMLAVNTSLVEPLPHQITAVYQEMLPRQPLRFLLADDPGAGKTIMAGLLIKELMARGDVQRCMVVCPGSLVEQWQDELWSKFHLPFEIMTNDKLESARTGNWFQENPLAICRLDKLSRDESLHPQIQSMDWDLVIADEAHKMSASVFGNEVNYTGRYRLGEMLSSRARHFLLLTATPHNGKDQDFQLFLRLLDEDRFEGAHRRSVKPPDISDMMRRVTKEQLLKFDGTPLFPERRAYSPGYELTEPEVELYEAVTEYVRNQFNRADRLSAKGKGTVGFALTILQRRLASSPAAIHQSLIRRRERLDNRLSELRQQGPTAWAQGILPSLSETSWEDIEDRPGDEIEQEEQRLIDEATTATTESELEAEIESLRKLETLAADVRWSGQDRKWDELSKILQHEEMRTADGSRRKLVIFTEHTDTLRYLRERITTLVGSSEAVATISGGMSRNERRAAQEAFRNDRNVHFLVATDAAGEGINLQNAHLMVNYDLPWNPNRLEQRFGRIHRIGQSEVCHLWNLVASNTREGEVFQRLFRKLAEMRTALGGTVYDVLGRVFTEDRLEDLLKEAIRYSTDPVVKARLFERVDNLLEQERVQGLVEQRALVKDSMDFTQVQRVREEMDRAAARRLQPHHISGFFQAAFQHLGGSLRPREAGRFEITHVPQQIRQAATVRDPRRPLARRYQRITFDKSLIEMSDRPRAEFVSPGHPLLDTVVAIVLEKFRHVFQQGALLIDSNDEGASPRLLVYLEHAISDGRRTSEGNRATASRRFQFVEIEEDGSVSAAGYAPFLDYRSPMSSERSIIEPLLGQSWLRDGVENLAIQYAIENIVPQHLSEVRRSREDIVNRTMAAVQERLSHEIQYWNQRYVELKRQQDAGRQPKMNPDQARHRVEDLEARRERRLDELAKELDLTPQPPSIVGAAVIVPAGLLESTAPSDELKPGLSNTAETERIAMDAVMAYERGLGCQPADVSGENRGYDIESRPSEGPLRFIEVKGRIEGADSVTVTRNEILTALNKPDQFWLAIVRVREEGTAEEPVYLDRPFTKEPEFATTHITLDLSKLADRIQGSPVWE